MRLVFVIVAILASTAAMGSARVEKNDLLVIENRLKENLLQQKADATMLYSTSTLRDPYIADSAGLVNQWMKTQRTDGSWPDIDYTDMRRSDWPVAVHTARMALMAIEYASHHDQQLATGTLHAWDWWTSHDLKNSNWYPNQISVPGNLCAVALLLKDIMSPEQMNAGVAIMKRARASSTGSNLAEMAMIQVGWGCLSNDSQAVEDAFRKVAADIAPRVKDGLQPDHSFRYHGTQLYAGSYGSVYTMKAAFLLWLASGTRFEFPPDKTAFVSAFVLDGQRWMIYRGQLDPGAIGRAVTIVDMPSRYTKEKILPGVSLLTMLPLPRRQEFVSFKDELMGGKSSLSGDRFFWNTLFMAHRRPDYSISMRMCSDQVDNAEQCNLEGFCTHHTADGVTIIKRTGDEYTGIFPVWDWRRIPGITAEAQTAPLQGSPRYKGTSGFVGGVSDGTFGAAAFDLTSGTLSARKAWFCFDREVVCLGTGITCPSDNPVLTSVNQCHLQGKVAQGQNWVVHDGIGYAFPTGKFVLKTTKQTGSWRLINGNLSDEPVQEDIFSLWLDHGKSPKGASYEYIILPGAKSSEMPGYMKNSPMEVLRNDGEVQAVWHRKLGIFEAAFRAAGEISLGDGRRLSVDGPCLVIVRGNTITLAGQARATDKSASVRVKLSGSSLLFELPQGELAGMSITRAQAH